MEKLRFLTQSIAVNRSLHIVVFLTAFVLLCSRQPDKIFNPQFWAEDGTIFYASAHNLGAIQSLFLPYAGYLSAAQRAIASLTQAIPLVIAPLVFNLLALSAQVLPVSLILSDRFTDLIPSFVTKLLLIFLYLGLPNCAEIHGNVTNIQWYLAVSACLVIVAQPSDRLSWRCFDVAVVTLSAFSGPFAILLLPLALVCWRFTKQRWLLGLIAILAAGAMTQAVIIGVTAEATRTTSFISDASLQLFAKILAGRIFVSTLIGAYGFANLLPWLEHHNFILYPINAIGLLIWLYALLRGPLSLRIFILFSLLVLGAALKSALVPWHILSLPNSAGRYWFLPMLAWVAALVWMFGAARPPWLRILASLAIAVMFTGIALDWQHPALVDLNFSQSVQEYTNTPIGKTVTIPINPPPWSMQLVKR